MSSPWTMISMSLVMVGCGGDAVWSIADRKADKDSAGLRKRPALTCSSTMRLGLPRGGPLVTTTVTNEGH